MTRALAATFVIVSSLVAVAVEPPTTSEIRRNVALQIALERAGFSPGLIDGTFGPKTTLALREFQRNRKLPVTGQLDAKARATLNVDEDDAFTRYTITVTDKASIGSAPTDWNARARLHRMAYSNLAELVAERHHCHRRLLAQLNPSRPLDALTSGETLFVPNIPETYPAAVVARLLVNLSDKTIQGIAPNGEVVALFHCSIPAKREKWPSGQTRVEAVAENPTYTFDPQMWPEVKNVREVLTIPPGPRNPVGIRWIGLGLPGVGIHGSPTPEMIGKTGSHGCIRLTNWDATRLARLVSVGTPVKFIIPGERLVESSSR